MAMAAFMYHAVGVAKVEPGLASVAVCLGAPRLRGTRRADVEVSRGTFVRRRSTAHARVVASSSSSSSSSSELGSAREDSAGQSEVGLESSSNGGGGGTGSSAKNSSSNSSSSRYRGAAEGTSSRATSEQQQVLPQEDSAVYFSVHDRLPDAVLWFIKLNDSLWNSQPLVLMPEGRAPADDGQDTGTSKSRFAGMNQRVITGFILGAMAVAYVFSGPIIFAAGISLISLLGQLEYYALAEKKGNLPARRTGILTTLAMVITSIAHPHMADVIFPIGAVCICCYLLFRKRQATIADISTSFLGLFYTGLLPTYWVRLYAYQSWGPVEQGVTQALIDKVQGVLQRVLPAALFAFVPALDTYIKAGAIVIFWTWLANALADVGAYAVGKKFGRTNFTAISPKKTIEGALGGIACAILTSLLCARHMQWPFWIVTGTLYGAMIGVVGLLGDLTESLFKRDAGVKDSGDFIPGHGGILDRCDSHLLVAPLVFYVITLAIPALRAFAARAPPR
ncbi:Phosphatidate cytidylyltransferase [Porphyridium purpureum]|uniref:phosphatidate cytidylyltransferase n=1 Tax=Porphyridium purpureum TaxID=35688 RepID=A0A5J4Z5J1_PORPP|nr:Phosphatidate cytidylyltransferase [Porphyridium purpureum]|eukprot:POR1595..scf295_1